MAFYASGTGYKIEYLIIVYQVQYKALYEFRMNAKRTQTNHEFSWKSTIRDIFRYRLALRVQLQQFETTAVVVYEYLYCTAGKLSGF